MIAFNRRGAGLAALALLACSLILAACGDNEPEQRKAFMAFLQTRIIDRPGVHVPAPNGEDISSFGPYAAHYKVITDFVGDAGLMAMNKTMNDALPQLRSFKDLIDKRAEVKIGGERLRETIKAADGKLAETEKAHAALKQPDDLKKVYDAAFDKVITKPMQSFHETTPIALDIIGAALKLADYMVAHADTVKIVGTSPQASDRKTQAEVNALAIALNANAPRMAEAQRRLRIVLQGS
jgi:Protein of unknown function (DUF3053)